MTKVRAGRYGQGFSLIELMVVITIIAIGLGLALPELSGFARRNQISSGTNELLTAINLARAEAVKRGAAVTVCASATPNSAAATCSGSNQWESGYIVFVDTNVNGTRQAAEELLRSSPASPTNLGIQLNMAGTAVRFAPNGMLNGTIRGAHFVVSSTASPTSREQRHICISAGGRASAMSDDTYLNDARFSGC
jgi:type IV fimbrial biogenesis protein FimT